MPLRDLRELGRVAVGEADPHREAALGQRPGPVGQQPAETGRERVALARDLLAPQPADLVRARRAGARRRAGSASRSPRSDATFRLARRTITGSGARIQPMRRPPQKSFDSEPIDSTGAFGASAAIARRSRALERDVDERLVLDHRQVRALAARRATSRRAPSGSEPPVGLWNVGVR